MLNANSRLHLRERVEVEHAEREGDEGADRRLGSNQRMNKTIPLTTSFHRIYTLPPYPYPKAPCSGLGMVYRDEKKKWRRVTADDIASPWPRRYSSPISWLWNSLHFNPPPPPKSQVLLDKISTCSQHSGMSTP